jgi:hypothetical protein
MTLELVNGQVKGLVRGAGCLCIRLEVGQWVLVLEGVLTAWWERWRLDRRMKERRGR